MHSKKMGEGMTKDFPDLLIGLIMNVLFVCFSVCLMDLHFIGQCLLPKAFL